MSTDMLLDDIWRSIGLKLGAADRIRFRAVSKSWMSLIPSLPPWLMLAQSEEGQESASEDEAEYPHHEDQGDGEFGVQEDEDEDGYGGEEVEVEEEEEEEEEDEDEDEEEEEEEEENDGIDESVNKDQQTPAPPPPPRGFVSLGDQQIHYIHCPDLHKAQCVGSTGNWLITTHKDKTIRLLNPFSRQKFYLPPQSTFHHKIYQVPNEKFRHLQLWKVILSASPDGPQRDCIAMALHSLQRLAIARLGDDHWTTVACVSGGVEDIIFYKGHFYAIAGNGLLFLCDIGDDLTPPTTSRLNEGFRLNTFYSLAYLVEWLGELLLVIKIVDLLDSTYKTNKFEVYKFDFVNKKWVELTSLGEHSLFLGFNTSVSLRASDYFGLVEKNCIYFTDDYLNGFRGLGIAGGHDMGVFHLEDNSITPHFRGVSTCLYSPPLWIVPS